MSFLGVAEKLDEYSQADLVDKTRGSPAFQPPEVASGCGCFSGFKVDVWAAGVTLYLISTGKVPFAGSSLISLFEKISAGAFEIPECLTDNAPLVDLLRGLLQVEQSARLGVQQALAHPWMQEHNHPNGGWGAAERDLVQAAVHARGLARSHSVLRAIASKYNEQV